MLSWYVRWQQTRFEWVSPFSFSFLNNSSHFGAKCFQVFKFTCPWLPLGLDGKRDRVFNRRTGFVIFATLEWKTRNQAQKFGHCLATERRLPFASLVGSIVFFAVYDQVLFFKTYWYSNLICPLSHRILELNDTLEIISSYPFSYIIYHIIIC